MSRNIILIIAFAFCHFLLRGQTNYSNDTIIYVIEIDSTELVSDTNLIIQKSKLEAIACWILGVGVGLHRIYLGSKPILPVFYALTLGGVMGIIPIIDLIVIISTKDIRKYVKNNQILMWADP
jgi:hypothetical protein